MFRYDYPHPAVTVDIVVFTIRDANLAALFVKRKEDPYRGSWALPGGFVRIDESLDQAAERELREETGVEGVYLEQLFTFGEPNRDPRERVITVAYYALIPSDRLTLRAASDAEDARATAARAAVLMPSPYPAAARCAPVSVEMRNVFSGN